MKAPGTEQSVMSRAYGWAQIVLPGIVALATGLPWVFGERWAGDGPYYQAIALNASRRGHWWTLFESDIPYLNKPPLGFWMHAVAAKVFGEGDWQYRVPELACFVLISVVAGAMARRWTGPAAGVFAGVIMACTWEWTRWIAFFRLDMWHTLFMLAAVAYLMRAAESPERTRRFTIGAGVLLGLALNTKPLFAFIVPVMIVAWLVLTRGLSSETERPTRVRRGLAACAWSALIGFALALPWHIGMCISHGSDFVTNYFVTQSVDRAIGARFRPDPWHWYLSYWFANLSRPLMIGTWPILTLAAVGVWMTLRRRFRLRLLRDEAPVLQTQAWIRLGMMALLWTVTWFVLMCFFGDKRDYYTLVLYPGLAILGGMAIARALKSPGEIWTRRLAPLATLLALASAMITIVQRDTIRQNSPLRDDIRELGAFLSKHPAQNVYNGGMRYNDAALAFIVSGTWPRTLVEKAPVPPELLPIGALAVYDTDPAPPGVPARPKPLPQDERIFQSGRFTIIQHGGG